MSEMSEDEISEDEEDEHDNEMMLGMGVREDK